MSDDVTITLSHDEALVLLEFFGRFDGEDNDFTLRHNAEFLAFMRISAQLDKALVEMFDPKYIELVHAARERLAAGYEGLAPGVHGDAG
jgi:hypothetical protein